MPLDVFLQGVQHSKRRSRRNAHAPQESKAGSGTAGGVAGRADPQIQPAVILLLLLLVAQQQEKPAPESVGKRNPGATQERASPKPRSTPSRNAQGKRAQVLSPTRSWLARFEKWHWCLGFTLCQSLIGIILLVCSINPYGISCSMLAPGIMYAVYMVLPDNRRKPTDSLATTYVLSGCLTLIFAGISTFS
jgi:hypothetical protein